MLDSPYLFSEGSQPVGETPEGDTLIEILFYLRTMLEHRSDAPEGVIELEQRHRFQYFVVYDRHSW